MWELEPLPQNFPDFPPVEKAMAWASQSEIDHHLVAYKLENVRKFISLTIHCPIYIASFSNWIKTTWGLTWYGCPSLPYWKKNKQQNWDRLWEHLETQWLIYAKSREGPLRFLLWTWHICFIGWLPIIFGPYLSMLGPKQSSEWEVTSIRCCCQEDFDTVHNCCNHRTMIYHDTCI